MSLALLAKFIEVINVQPRTRELGREAARARVFDHATRLRSQDVGIAQLAAGGDRSQFRVRS